MRLYQHFLKMKFIIATTWTGEERGFAPEAWEVVSNDSKERAKYKYVTMRVANDYPEHPPATAPVVPGPNNPHYNPPNNPPNNPPYGGGCGC